MLSSRHGGRFEAAAGPPSSVAPTGTEGLNGTNPEVQTRTPAVTYASAEREDFVSHRERPPTARYLLIGVVICLLAAAAPLSRGSHSFPESTDQVSAAGTGKISLPVIVQGGPGEAGAAAAAVRRLGGTVTRRLDIVDGVAATVPRSVLAALEDEEGVYAVSPNRPVHVQAKAGPVEAIRSAYRDSTGASALAADGISGKGVTVALVDTGVAKVTDVTGRVLNVTDPVTGVTDRCVDFSGEGQCGDSYGHGTFMAGIIAGSGASSGGRWKGMAPAAKLVSLKVAGRDGSSDVSKVLAAIQWVVSFRQQYGIRVLNLSLGTDSTQSWTVDPLNYAVERAWQAGIVVTVAASNRGPSPRTISKPGDDPWVLTVGAVDDRGTAPIEDDRLPDFSSRGPTAAGIAKPDVVAPGAHLVSLRAPGSAIDGLFPSYVDGSYRRGSGTSMAAAVVSGGVALLLERNPGWTPGQVKEALRTTARPAASGDPSAVGAGEVRVNDAASAAGGVPVIPASRSNGLGSLDASRGSVRVQTDDPLGIVLNGLLTAQLLTWDSVGFTTGNWDATTWPLSVWALRHWYATKWYGDDWQGDTFQGNNWHGDWEGSTWNGQRMNSDTYGKPYKGAAWYGLWE